MDKFYDILKEDDKKFYSLNFFLSEKINTIPIKPIKMLQKKSIDKTRNNEEQSNFLFFKFISRCVGSLSEIVIEKR